MADKTLYQQIADDLRQRIQHGQYKPGDSLPSVRQIAREWDCTPGTVSRAYKDLSRQGLVVTERGRGTRVALGADRQRDPNLAWADLVHQAEAVLLNGQRAGFEAGEVMAAFAVAGARLATLRAADSPQPHRDNRLTFCGSHDLALEVAAAYLAAGSPPYRLEMTFAGSLSGLRSLSKGTCQIAGSHLWDPMTQEYNLSQVQQFMPQRRVALVTLAHRHLGLIVASGNPSHLESVQDLARGDIRLVNRPASTGTRRWLDGQLKALKMETTKIAGYQDERPTHLAVARAVADGEADATIGIEAAAAVFGLTFVPLTTERYDLVIPAEEWNNPIVKALMALIQSPEWQASVNALQGYELHATGTITWLPQ
ncbi:MAG: substrate-binding domain-containing protein [Anaerolineales bacterium]|jgi:molybdate-binding protein/DNA-binding transcriptional regulator YhcF (GntR family)